MAKLQVADRETRSLRIRRVRLSRSHPQENPTKGPRKRLQSPSPKSPSFPAFLSSA
ncbi:hypothetical protein GBA52_016653 [Prunus armeniaca]|nr:hypothetical protein GBA52_016653 [Prunus armeniaca]